MPRPTVLHQGFFVPNAQDVVNPELAEPDRIDFNTIAHTRWGVLSGCLVTVSGAMATNTPGTALVNGKLVQVAGGQNVSVGAGGAQDRFDIVGVNDKGVLVGIAGTESLDPVFPDVPLDVTTLAAVMCTSGGSSYADNVIDKRKLLADSLLTKIPPEQDLVVNRNGTGNLFGVGGDGKTVWNGDTTLQRHDVGVLRVISSLRIDDALAAGGAITGRSLVVTERVLGSNLRSGSTIPGAGNTGDLFTNNADGAVYVYKSGAWKEIATVESAVPMGSIITSLRPAGNMPPGWVPLDGSAQVFQATQAELFALLDSWGWSKSGIAPNQVITTRNANRRMLMVDFASPGGTVGGTSSITIGRDNMPEHDHEVDVQPAGAHTPVVRINRIGGHVHPVSGGAHGHNDVPDPGHVHHGAADGRGGQFICAAWGGQNKIDAFFNDRSHTWSVDAAWDTNLAKTGITYIGSAGSEHQHEAGPAGDHDHPATVEAVPAHDHVVFQKKVGLGTPLTYAPAHLTVFCYIKA